MKSQQSCKIPNEAAARSNRVDSAANRHVQSSYRYNDPPAQRKPWPTGGVYTPPASPSNSVNMTTSIIVITLTRHASDTTLPGPQEHSAHCSIYRTGGKPLQGLLARLNARFGVFPVHD